MSGRTGGTARITERKLKPTSVIKVQTITLRQVTVMRPSPEVDALFFTRVSKPGRYNIIRCVLHYITVDSSPTSCSRQSVVELALILHFNKKIIPDLKAA